MKKLVCVLLFAALCLPALGSPASAAPKAYGFSDQSGTLKESDRAALDAALKEIYEKYGVSVYMNLLSDANVKIGDYVTQFFIENVAPYAGENKGQIQRGVVFAWDAKKSDYFGAPFPSTDNRAMSAFSAPYLNPAVSASFKSASSVFGALSNLATALQRRADEYYGANPSGEVAKAPADPPGPGASDMAMAKAPVYTIDGEKIPSIYGVVGEREIIAAQSGREGDAEYIMAAYKTSSIEDDAAKFFTALGKDGWAVTNQEGTYDKGSGSVSKHSKDAGHILVVTIEFRGASYQVNAAKMPGTLNLNKPPAPQPAAPVAMTYLFYDAFTMQVPKDWTVEKTKNGASITSADTSSSISIQLLEPFTQAPSREFAEKLRAQSNGSALKDNGDGLFSFTAERDGKTIRSIAGVVKTSGIFIHTTGQDPSLEAALKTLQLKLTVAPDVTELNLNKSPATASNLQFWFNDSMTIQTPKDWTMEKHQNIVYFLNGNKKLCIEVAVLEPFPAASREFAEIVRKSVEGSELKETSDGLFAYANKEPDGAAWRNIVGMIGTSRVVIRASGDDPNLEAALKTLKLKLTFGPNVTALF